MTIACATSAATTTAAVGAQQQQQQQPCKCSDLYPSPYPILTYSHIFRMLSPYTTAPLAASLWDAFLLASRLSDRPCPQLGDFLYDFKLNKIFFPKSLTYFFITAKLLLINYRRNFC